MLNKKIILCRGIQGSGKSTWAKQWVLEDPEHRVRFNNDDERYMVGGGPKGYWVPNRESFISEIKHKFIISAMHKGYDIVVDNMNLSFKEFEFYKKIVDQWNDPIGDIRENYEIEFKDFFIPVEECIRRDALRPNPIGEKIIRQTWNKYKDFIQNICINKYVKSRLQQKPQSKAIVLDMDSTLCFNTTGRPWYGDGAAEGILTDTPNIPIINLAKAYSDFGYHIFIITGRDTSLAESTEQWLKKYKVSYDKVFYRKHNDFSKSCDIKYDIINKLLEDYNIELIIDDAEPVVEMYRKMGLTVLQPERTI